MIDHEVTPLLSEVPGVDLTKYKTTLIERFANPAIRDRLQPFQRLERSLQMRSVNVVKFRPAKHVAFWMRLSQAAAAIRSRGSFTRMSRRSQAH
jgi:mannitol-1-phosphate/altronate dehydrogenase